MSDTRCNYINLLDYNSELNVKSLVKWKLKPKKLHNKIITLYDLIDTGDGVQI